VVSSSPSELFSGKCRVREVIPANFAALDRWSAGSVAAMAAASGVGVGRGLVLT
jgi:hypothetical protein